MTDQILDLNFEPIGIMPDDVPPFDAPISHSPNGRKPTLIDYARGGLSPVPCLLPDKRPALPWEQYQEAIADDKQLTIWQKNDRWGVGIVCGEVSGGLEVIDFETRADFEKWRAAVEHNAPGLAGKLTIETTLHGGVHVAYRCADIAGNQKLARTPREIPGHRPDTDGITTLIETRGEGGYLVCYPTRGYSLLQGDWRDVQSIGVEYRDLLLTCAQDLDEIGQAPLWPAATPLQPDSPKPATPQRSAVYDLLTRHGWSLAEKKHGVEYWKRAGTDAHHSATWNFVEGRFKVFSTNAAPFESDKLYTPAQVQALLEPATNKDQAWRLYSMKDARAPRDPLRFIVEGLIVSACLIILYGAPGTLKSMVLADLAVCVAAGLPWLAALPGEGGSARRVTPCVVLWLDFDNGRRRTDERFDAIGRAHGVPDDIPFYYVSMPSPWLDASANDSVVRLADQIREINAGLVVIDNLGTVTGKADENSAEMINVMAHLRWLAEFTGAAIVVIHHQRKGTAIISRAGETLRGHSSIEAALDLALLVEREAGASLVSVKSTKTRDVDVAPFGAQFSFEHKDGSKELQAARFFGVAVEDTTSDQAIERAIIEAVTLHHPINQTKLANAVKDALPEIGNNRIRQLANKMVSKKRLTSTSGAHGARLYDLP